MTLVQSLHVGFVGSLGCQFFFSPLLVSLTKSIDIRAVASGPAGQAMAGPVLINYVDTHAQMQQLSAMVLLRVESRLNILP